MRLSALIEHTGKWTGFTATTVGSFARFLREARQISGGVKGGGAAAMSAGDMISLLVAVLGCGTARSCSLHLPRLRSLPLTRSETSIDATPLTYLAQPDLQRALLALFDDIDAGRFAEWRRGMERKGMTGTAFELVLTFDVDGDHVEIELTAKGSAAIGDKPGEMHLAITQHFGKPRQTELPGYSLPGYSRRIHQLSLERLAGWGECLKEAIA